ncbi:BTAD domain-containing putative transcriptional regulator [Bradyrhizobium sp. OK095]|uniref:BTAD domain-containing putative transcriptional regulator n=1 Tax=Bradyrhizobium sp. OK095 TaxID=1882760 RepID=UPI000B83BCA6|nr:BTAD domain-containing putative transcriptional regulator [Bradyrhizobium sp. OK095]
MGGLSVAFAGRDIRIKSRKSRALLGYLALTDRHQETRERLVGLLWSESDEYKARASLRQVLHELRETFLEAGYDGLQIEKMLVELERDRLQVDLWDALREAEAQHAHPALMSAPGLMETLLEGLDDIDPSFRVWLLAKRQTFHDRILRALEGGLRNVELAAANRRELAEAILSLDPTHEEACRYAMQTRAEEGDLSGALRVYRTLWNILDEEYGMEPSAKTQQLIADIKNGHFEGEVVSIAGELGLRDGAPASSADEVPRQSPALSRTAAKIAILVDPFSMNGVSADRVHLVTGFRHHLIACLTKFREWYVGDGTAQQPLESRERAAASRYSVAATAYQAGDTISMVLTLRETNTGVYIWSDTFELKLENWFQVQQRIVQRTALSVNVYLSTERLTRVATAPDVSLDIYDRWLRAQASFGSFSAENWRESIALLTKAINVAPNFSPCYSALVQLNNTEHLVFPGLFRDLTKARSTLELARTAVQLDPVDSRAQLCLGWSQAMLMQYSDASGHIDLACELNGNDPWTLLSAASCQGFCGNFERGTELVAEALKVSWTPPPLHWPYRAVLQFMRGNYQEAIEGIDRASNVAKTLPGWKAAALFHLGRTEEARLEARKFLDGIRAVWFGKPPNDREIALWLLHAHPIARREDWERLRDGLGGAGVSVVDLRHHAW